MLTKDKRCFSIYSSILLNFSGVFHRGCEHVLSLFSHKSPFLSLMHTGFSLPLYLLTSYLCTCPLLIFSHWCCILLVFYIPVCLSQIYLDFLEFSGVLWCHRQIKCMWRNSDLFSHQYLTDPENTMGSTHTHTHTQTYFFVEKKKVLKRKTNDNAVNRIFRLRKWWLISSIWLIIQYRILR